MKSIALLLFITVLASACGNELAGRTQVLVTIDAAAAVKERTDALRVELFSGPRGTEDWTRVGEERFDTGKTDFVWPASLALLPKSEGDDRGFRLLVHAEQDGKEILEVRAASYFISEKTLLLELTLDEACIEYFGCDQGKTCVGQGGMPQCVDEKVDAKDLSAIDKPPRSGGSSNGNTDAGKPALDAGSDAAVACTDLEICTNDRDDDCDDLPDCADPDCAEQVACVPTAEKIGVLVAANEDCPAGYAAKETLIHRGLRDLGCTGCSCGSAAPTSCSATVYTYAADSQDGNGNCITGLVADTYQIVSGGCVQTPFTTKSYKGWSVGAISVVGGSCAGVASGTATLLPPAWDETRKFCAAKLGGGCGEGQVCAPVSSAPGRCRAVPSGSQCQSGNSAEEWYEGYDDMRTCGGCKCSSSGASCAEVKVRLGSDYSCDAAAGGDRGPLASGEKLCVGFPYSPPGYLVGSPSDATCEPAASTTGQLNKAKPLALCCE